jgi:CelD/BcsL family acetyltransferase involved in cellulose biosynthesis
MNTSVLDAVTLNAAALNAAALDTASVEMVTTIDAFDGLAVEWNDAVDRAGFPHPFLRHEWMRAWWQAFGAGHELHLIVVRRHGRIEAIAPLLRESARMHGMTVRRLRLLHNDHTPRADLIVAGNRDESYRAESSQAESYRVIWNALMAERDSWDVLQLGQIPADSPTHAAIAALAAQDGCAVGTWRSGASPYVAVRGSWQEYLGGRSAKLRQNVRNRLGRLTRIGEPVLEVVCDPAAIVDAGDDLRRLEDSGWKGDAGTAIDSDRAVRTFYDDLSLRASAAGWLRLLFLTVNGQRIAVSYSAQFDNRLFLIKTGYDPGFAACSPFKVLTSLALEHAFAEGLAEVDFLGDSEPWKLDWTTNERQHDWLYVFSRSARARLVHSMKFQVAPALKRLGA